MVILAAISLLYTFSKWNFHNKFINWMALGCFAVYIIHYNPFVFKYFKESVLWIGGHSYHLLFLLEIGLFLFLVFLVCVLIDQLRILSWKTLFKH